MKTSLGLLAGLLLSIPGPVLAGAKIEIGKDRFFTLGAGTRVSFTALEDAAPNGKDYKKDFNLESIRLYSGGQLMRGLGLEFNADYQKLANNDDKFRMIDAIVKLELSPKFNIWAGRFLPPGDRANFSGPYFLNSWDYPFVSANPAIFAGRDNGIAYWGQFGEGAVKWQGGVFQGNDDSANSKDALLYTGRFTLNFWDGEAGYYNGSTYYGEKDILALGFGTYMQKGGASFTDARVTDADGNGPLLPTAVALVPVKGDFRSWSVDFLMEKKLLPGVLSIEGAAYRFNRQGIGSAGNEGNAYMAVLSWLFPGKIGAAGWPQARLQPLVRYQRFNPDQRLAAGVAGFDAHERWDLGLNFIFDGHNARATLTYSLDKDDVRNVGPAGNTRRNLITLGVQLQI